MTFPEALALHGGIWCAEKAYHLLAKQTRQKKFLQYDPGFLLDCYRDETPVGQPLPYVYVQPILGPQWSHFLSTAKSFRVAKVSKDFELAPSPPRGLRDFQAHAIDEFRRERRFDHNDPVVRLQRYDARSRTLHVQRCFYEDGLKSNYAMDLQRYLHVGGCDISLRTLLQTKWGYRLPPFAERRLSNAIGISVVVFYRTDAGEVLPYLPLRTRSGMLDRLLGLTKGQAVFTRGGYHCTASGETWWNAAANSFDELFTADICRELEEEVGLKREDLTWIYPVAFCREFLRGGKPQLFFAGYTGLDAGEINRRRRDAIEAQKARGRQEIEDEVLIASTPDELYETLWREGTIEAVTNLAFAHDCAVLAYRARQLR